jgi:hypothetical protein
MSETDNPPRPLRVEASPLRVEASPQALSRLSRGPEGQQSAVAELLKRLNETLHEIDSDKNSSSSKHSPSTRKSRLQFWSGEPGIGKTSAYLSARQWFNDQTNDFKRKIDDKDKIEDNLRVQLNAIGPHASRIRWLESLDLELLSGRPNFLASVAVRIDKALNLRPPDEPDGQDTWLSSGTSDFREALADFWRLKNEIALSWEGNLTSRGGELDPDAYASEVIRAENARLEVSLHFGQTVTQLARCAPGSRGKSKSFIFILPIDDFYTHPNLSLDILRLLRMISCAHLFVLMLGNMDHLQRLSFGHSLGEFSNLLGNNGARFLNKDSKSYICQLIENRTAGSLHKLIPSNQVFRLLPMRAHDTLDYRPQDDNDRTFQERFEYFMNRFLDPQLEKSEKKIDDAPWWIDDAPWWIIYALEMTPRNVADLYQAIIELEQNIPQETDKRERYERNETLKLISEQVERALFESLPHDIAARVWSDMSVNWGSFYQRQFPANTLRLEVITVKTEKPVSGELTESQIVRMYVRNSEIEIPPRARGWLAVLYYAIRHHDTKSEEIRELDHFKWIPKPTRGGDTPANEPT